MNRRVRRRLRRFIRRRRWHLVAIVVLLIAGAAAIYFTRPPSFPRDGSIEIASRSIDIGARTPDSYRIVYRSENHAGEKLVVNTDELVVSRPFEARSTTRHDGEEVAATMNGFARLKTGNIVVAVSPAPAPLDRRAATFLPDAVSDGYAEARETRRVARRACRIYRMATASEGAGRPKVEDAGDDYTDLCVDEAGLVLEEITISDGEALTRRVATSVSEDPDLDEDALEVGEPTLEVAQGGGSVRRLTRDSRAPTEAFWELDDAPADGFELDGRYAVVPPQTGFDDPAQRSRLIAFTADVWVDGNDVIVIEQGGTLGGSEPFAEDPNAKDVDAGEIGDAQITYGDLTAELRVLLGRGRFVRMVGTVAPSELVEVARSLERKKGGELVFEE